MSVAGEMRVFSVADYHRMAEAGILSEDDHVELIEGRIVVMSPKGGPHASCVKRLIALLSPQTVGAALLSVQDPIQLGEHSEPEPDLALLRPRDDYYAGQHPGPADVLLLIEVADSSETYDRDEKIPLYARFGIVETWLVSLRHRRVEVHTQPSPAAYRQVRLALPGETIAPERLPAVSVAVDALF